MARITYTNEQIDFLRKGCKRMALGLLTTTFNARFGVDKTESAIKAAMSNRKIVGGRGNKTGVRSRVLLDDKQALFIKKMYKKYSIAELTEVMNKKFNLQVKTSQLRSYVQNHKITSGRTGHYEKGSVPFNAGTKGFMKPNSGSFAKGLIPKNYKPLGHERICKKDGYILIKVADRNPWNDNPSGWYRHKHVVLWEEKYGPVPEGSCLRFKDGNKKNVFPENLILVSRGEHLRLTNLGYNDQPEELKPAVLNIARLEQQIYEVVNGSHQKGVS